MKALIDADRFSYMLGCATKDDGVTPLEWPFVVSRLDSSISNILLETECDDYQLYLTDSPSNFRVRLATIKQYKGTRSPEKPYWHDKLRAFMCGSREALLCKGYEADDKLGIDQDDNTIIASVDKDLDMIPGWHYNPMKKEKYFMESLPALACFYKQLLTGDPTDNILGLHGVGSKSAHLKKIDECEHESQMYQICINLYKKYFGSYWRQFLYENAALLWIKRKETPRPEDEIHDRLIELECLLESDAS